MGHSAAERALRYIRKAPRIQLYDLRDNPGARTKGRQVRAKDNRMGKSLKELSGTPKPPIGWTWGNFFRPWQRGFPGDKFFNKDIQYVIEIPIGGDSALRREYPPMSLLELQRLIDLGWIDLSKAVDLTTLCNTGQYKCNPIDRQFGVQLTDQGADIFSARINLEVQWASELAIAAVERNGGCITCAYYDPVSLEAVVNPIKFFTKGQPIPKRAFPPADIMARYSDPKLRGYLADPDLVAAARVELSQKYGYELQEPSAPSERKDPLQVFYGLQPGWIVNLRDRVVLKPKDSELRNYYNS